MPTIFELEQGVPMTQPMNWAGKIEVYVDILNGGPAPGEAARMRGRGDSGRGGKRDEDCTWQSRRPKKRIEGGASHDVRRKKGG